MTLIADGVCRTCGARISSDSIDLHIDYHAGLRFHDLKVRGVWERVTPRERQILHLMCRGMDDIAIAADLFISKDTVRTHVTNVMRKLDVHTRRALVALAWQNGWAERAEEVSA